MGGSSHSVGQLCEQEEYVVGGAFQNNTTYPTITRRSARDKSDVSKTASSLFIATSLFVSDEIEGRVQPSHVTKTLIDGCGILHRAYASDIGFCNYLGGFCSSFIAEQAHVDANAALVDSKQQSFPLLRMVFSQNGGLCSSETTSRINSQRTITRQLLIVEKTVQ